MGIDGSSNIQHLPFQTTHYRLSATEELYDLTQSVFD